MDLIRRKVADSRVLGLIEAFLKQGVLDGMSEWTPETGTPQGAVISPLLANIYLDPLDQHMAERGYAMVRYADDFVILCRSADEAERALGEVQAWVAQAGLRLHPSKTRIVQVDREGFDFWAITFAIGNTGRGTRAWASCGMRSEARRVGRMAAPCCPLSRM